MQLFTISYQLSKYFILNTATFCCIDLGSVCQLNFFFFFLNKGKLDFCLNRKGLQFHIMLV